MSRSQALQTAQTMTETLKKVIMKGDLSGLTPEEQIGYYIDLCHHLKLDPLSKPFDFMEIEDKKTKRTKVILYANKECAAQLRHNNNISIWKVETKTEDGCLVATAYARTPGGKEDVDEGAIWVKGLASESLSNARMRAVTKAKRRVTLSICGLGFLDESEIDSTPNAQPIAHPEQEAVMTRSEAEQLTISNKASGLDQWKCGRALAMQLIGVCKRLEAEGVDKTTWHGWLPTGIKTRKDLTEDQAQNTFSSFQSRLEVIKQAKITEWNCSPESAIKLMDVYGQLIARGIDKTTIQQRLPNNSPSFRALSEAQAQEALKTFTHWLKTYNEVVQGEVVNNG